MSKNKNILGWKGVAIVLWMLFLLFAMIYLLAQALHKSQYKVSQEQTISQVAQPPSAWEIMEMAIIKTESNGNPYAVSPKNARGIFQITPIYVKEVNRLCKLHHIDKTYTHDDAFDVRKSFEMFDIMTTYHFSADTISEKINKVIKGHNPTAGEWYANRVYKAMADILADSQEYNKYIKLLES